MLIVEIKIWPFGNREREEVLGRLEIINDGTGNSMRGNYYTRSETLETIKVKDWPRLSKNVWELLREVLNTALTLKEK